MNDLSPRKVAIDPEWIPHIYSADGADLTFVHVPRKKRADLTFLSDEHYKAQFPKKTFPAAAITPALDGVESSPLHFIFHTSFCCSTLLVQALDIPGLAVGLKEPEVLVHLANRFVRGDDSSNRRRLELVLRLLARPFDRGEAVIVKPSNFANRLILPALDANPASRAVLLYSDMPTFLRSLVKRGLFGRIFGRNLYSYVASWTPLNLGYTPAETFCQTDLQIAGLAWLMQVHHISEAARKLGRDRVMIVDSADFTANVATTLDKIADFFGIALGSPAAAKIAAGPVFARHSKFSQRDYSFGAREQEHSKAEDAHGEEIDMVVKWVETVAAHMQVPLQPKVPATS